jgi:uncharacterized protein YmfQ (DUF2313 family)
MNHYEILKKLWPIPDMTGELDHDLGIEGKYLDEADSSTRNQLSEFFPDTADGSALTNWETLTDTTDQSSCTYVMQQLKKKDGWMSPNYYIGLCNRYGLDATIHEGLTDMFILGPVSPPASALPHAIADATHLWTWSVDTTGTIDSTQKSILQTKIIEQAPAWTRVSFTGTLA